MIDYHDIEGFPVSTVAGHKGRFVFAHINGCLLYTSVLTSNQVTLWGALRKARVGDKIPYLGKLFTI